MLSLPAAEIFPLGMKTASIPEAGCVVAKAICGRRQGNTILVAYRKLDGCSTRLLFPQEKADRFFVYFENSMVVEGLYRIHGQSPVERDAQPESRWAVVVADDNISSSPRASLIARLSVDGRKTIRGLMWPIMGVIVRQAVDDRPVGDDFLVLRQSGDKGLSGQKGAPIDCFG